MQLQHTRSKNRSPIVVVFSFHCDICPNKRSKKDSCKVTKSGRLQKTLWTSSGLSTWLVCTLVTRACMMSRRDKVRTIMNREEEDEERGIEEERRGEEEGRNNILTCTYIHWEWWWKRDSLFQWQAARVQFATALLLEREKKSANEIAETERKHKSTPIHPIMWSMTLSLPIHT